MQYQVMAADEPRGWICMLYLMSAELCRVAHNSRFFIIFFPILLPIYLGRVSLFQKHSPKLAKKMKKNSRESQNKEEELC